MAAIKINEDLCEKFRQLRFKLELSQKEFAQALGISLSYVKRIETKKRNVSRVVRKWCKHKFRFDFSYMPELDKNPEITMDEHQLLQYIRKNKEKLGDVLGMLKARMNVININIEMKKWA